MTELVHLDVAAGVATITLDSPANRNALSAQLRRELLGRLDTALADDAVRVVVLGHTGRVFCSGMDLKESRGAGAADQGVNEVPTILQRIWTAPKPVVAQVGGPTRAGGVGLVAACDIAVAATAATFAFSEVRIGVIPAVISASVLRRLSSRVATELYLTGDVFTGARAAEIGLVTAAVAPEALDGAVAAYAASIVRGAPGALTGAKDLLRRTRPDGFRDDVAVLTEISIGYFGSDEGREGVAAFQAKRDPAWVPSAAGDLE
jgi:methylglutaconyl-CoA hydratase